MSSSLLVDGSLFALNKHVLLENDEVYLTSNILHGNECVFSSAIEDDPRCVRTTMGLEGIQMPETMPAAYERMAHTLKCKEPWRLVSSSRRFSLAIDFLKDVYKKTLIVNKEYKNTFFNVESSLFHQFEPFAFANEIRQPPKYERVGTKTGRLKVSKGLKVLTMKRSDRSQLSSIVDGYSFFSFDFSSHEARIALSIAGTNVLPSEDPYVAAFPNMQRPDAKLATLASIYSDPNEIASNQNVAEVRDKFSVSSVYEKLSNELDETSSLRNLYGRKVLEPTQATLYSNYVQSTASDAAVLGFVELLNTLRTLGFSVRPHFVVHDALFASIKDSDVEAVKNVAALGVRVPRLNVVLPLTCRSVVEDTLS